MSELIESIERRQLRAEAPRLRMGDRVRVHFQVVEGTRRRTQVFEGVVMRIQGASARRTFTVRKISFGVGVERTFPLHSPKVERIEVMARGEVRRAKLYYLRGRVGRRARIKERRDLSPEDLAIGPPAEVAAAQAASDGEATETAEAAEAVEGAETADAAETAGAGEEVETTDAAPEPSDVQEPAEPSEAEAPAAPDGQPEDEQAPEAEQEPSVEAERPAQSEQEPAQAEEKS